MPIAYGYDSQTKKYIGEIQRQKDPLESEIAGHDVFLTPANSTDIIPPEGKEGFDIIWNGSGWGYKEKKKDPEPEQYVPTELDKVREELWKTERSLQDMDYIGTKIATGRATKEEYAEKIKEMDILAKKVNQLRQRISELESEQEVGS